MPYKDYEYAKKINRENKRKRTAYARENHLCICCFREIEEDRADKTTCFACSNKRSAEIREDRIFFKKIGICPRCQKNSLQGDERNCLECRAYNAEYAAKKRENNPDYKDNYNKWQRSYRKRLEEQGLCNRCGKRKADIGFKTCQYCRAKRREYIREKRGQVESPKERRIREGKCVWCENPIKTGYRVCEQHYQMQIEKGNHPKAVENRNKYKKDVLDGFYKSIETEKLERTQRK